jgi:hypothetical protein
MFFLLCLTFSPQQNWRIRGQNRFCLEARVRGKWEEEMAQIMYTHVSRCKNDKIKLKFFKVKKKRWGTGKQTSKQTEKHCKKALYNNLVQYHHFTTWEREGQKLVVDWSLVSFPSVAYHGGQSVV